ncbi:EAL domain-containing protein [Leptothrix ochracea]|uniref:EAL domain-containing protein n=1 Tax=Leptothrix ochracea TaxID=735331 RepID=UPI0034E1D031
MVIAGTGKDLVAMDALADVLIVRVTADQRHKPGQWAQSGVYAVFDEEDPAVFLGLVTEQDVATYPQRIFADLLRLNPISPVLHDVSLAALGALMESQGWRTLPVVDAEKTFLGVVTRASWLAALLARQKWLLEETRKLNEQIELDRQQKLNWASRLQDLHEAGRTLLALLAHSTIERDLLQGGIEALVKVIHARYGAIGILDADGHLSQFVHTGISAKAAHHIHDMPQGRGLLGVVTHQDVALRIDDIHADPRSAGFPAHHPHMTSLLAVPISHLGRVYGRIYLSDKTDSEPFSAEDELLTRSFASSLSLVLDNARRLEEVQLARHRLDLIAHFDALTGLPNRALLMQRLDHALALAQRQGTALSVLMLDLDNFKRINDARGHEQGDQLLNKVAERLRSVLNEDDLLSRLGGDEFAMLCTGRDHEATARWAQNVLASFKPPFDILNDQFFLSVSIGVACYPADSDSAAGLIRKADTAMYQAKESGKNSVRFFTADMDQAVQMRTRLEVQLRRALDQNEFRVYFQPQVDLRTHRIVGAEALIRWVREDGSMCPPSEFIPVAEETGLITPIGEWVLRQACAEAARWQRLSATPVSLAVNLSAYQFRHQDLSRLVQEILRETGLPAPMLELEITESLLVQDDLSVGTTMQDLRHLGVHFTVDDFGTGYSSLSYIRRFPVETIKIDQSFIRYCVQDHSAATLVEAILAMASSLNLRVVAEGVETIEQRELLRSLRCGYAQGYYFGRPMPAEDFAALPALTMGAA